MNKDHEKIVHLTSLETYTKKEIVNKVIYAYYEMCKEYIESSKMLEPDTYPKIMIPYIGSLIPNKKRILKFKSRMDEQNKVRENKQDNG